MGKTIYLIRHGETEHNNDRNRFSGISDIHLALNGKDHCKKLSSFFSNKEDIAVYTSPLNRAVESAKIVFPTIPPIIADGLIEFNYGLYEGLAKEDLHENDPIVAEWQTKPADLTFPEGGNVRHHAKFALELLLQLIENSKSDIIACVSHKTTIRLIISQIIGLDLNLFRKIPCSNCGVSEIHYSEKNLSVVSINFTVNHTKNMMEE